MTVSSISSESRSVLFESDAWKYLTCSRRDQGAHPFRTYLRLDWLHPLRHLVDHPFTLEEVTAMVSFDGEPLSETCVACDQKFTPVRWIDLNDPQFAALLDMGKSVLEAIKILNQSLLTFGAFYFNEKSPSIYGAVCGSPYFWHDGFGKYFPAKPESSHLALTMEGDPQKHWGLCRRRMTLAAADQGDIEMEAVLAQIEDDKRKAAQLAAQQEAAARVQAFRAQMSARPTPPKVTVPVRVPVSATPATPAKPNPKHHEVRVLVFRTGSDGKLKIVMLPKGKELKTLGGTNRELAYQNETPKNTGQREVKEESDLAIMHSDDMELLYQEVHSRHGHTMYFYMVRPTNKCAGDLRTVDKPDGADTLKPPKECSPFVAMRDVIPTHRKALAMALQKLAPDYEEAAYALL